MRWRRHKLSSLPVWRSSPQIVSSSRRRRHGIRPLQVVWSQTFPPLLPQRQTIHHPRRPPQNSPRVTSLNPHNHPTADSYPPSLNPSPRWTPSWLGPLPPPSAASRGETRGEEGEVRWKWGHPPSLLFHSFPPVLKAAPARVLIQEHIEKISTKTCRKTSD